MKKQTEIKLIADTMIEGESVAAGSVIAHVDSDCSVSVLASLLRARRVDLSVEQADEEVASDEEVDDEEIAEEVEEEGDEEVDVDESSDEPVDPGAALKAAGLNDKHVERLLLNNFTTPEAVIEFVKGGGDLVSLEKIGRGYADQIVETLKITDEPSDDEIAE